MQLSEDQIFALAPDEASKKAGKELSAPAKWVSKGMNAQAIWGECQGSGNKPYQTQIDTISLAFKCSCPSRKFPCKHGLGLLLLHARDNSAFTNDQPPQWVSDWLEKRTEKAAKKIEQKERNIDVEERSKSLVSRERSVEDGLEDVLLWMKDTVRNGILSIPEKGTAMFDALAKRMVDAKAPGLAGMFRSLGNINYYKEGWQSIFMVQLSSMYLTVAGFKNRATLHESLQEDIRSYIGFTQNQEQLKEQKGIEDHWLVLDRQVTEEENITTERNWLYGTNSKKHALVLQFSVRGQGISFSLTPASCIQAELVFFPSAVPLRAIIKKQIASNAHALASGHVNWQEVSAAFSLMSAAMPTPGNRPFIVRQLVPTTYNGQWYLQDADKQLMQLPENFSKLYLLLSLGGGKALDMAVLGRETIFEPMGAWVNGQYFTL